MRQLTAYASYLDNLGAPLVGRARFFNMDGSEAVVYSLDNATQAYVSIGSSVFTNSSGQLVPQVFLDNHDYIVVFDKYIGAGTMAEDDNPESWAEQGSAVDKYNTLGVVLDGDSVRSINTVAELKGTQVIDMAGGEVVMLLGYNVQGDKPAIFYRWNASSTKVDNGGSVIKVNDVSVGRWELTECPEYLDVRHFGAFPLEASVVNPIQRYAIQQAANYAHSNNCGIYFNASDTAIYYDITGLTLHDVDANPAARVFSKTPEVGDAPDSTKATIYGIVSIHCGGSTHGQIELVDATVRSSWEGDYSYTILSPTETLIIDSTLRTGSRTWSGIKVQMETYGGAYMVFDDCLITSNGAITGNVTIKNCELHSDWFSDDYLWSNLIPIGNTILLQNCDSADTYIKLKNRQNENDYGDLQEQVLDNAQLLAGAVIENCNGSVTLAGAAEMRNVNLTVTVSGTPYDLNCTDAWLTFTSAVFSNLSINRGRIYGTQLQATGAVVLKDVDIDMPLDVLGGSLKMYNCQVNKSVSHVGSPVVEEIMGNVFNSSLSVRGGGSNVVVNAKWVNNHGNYATPLVLDRTNLDPDDSNHTYRYQGNTGTFVNRVTRSVTVHQGAYTEGTPSVLGVMSGGIGLSAYTTTNNPSSKYFTTVRLFTVGTTNVKRNLLCTIRPQFCDQWVVSGSTFVATDSAGSGLMPTLVFDAGYQWKLMHLVLNGWYMGSGDDSAELTFEELQ